MTMACLPSMLDCKNYGVGRLIINSRVLMILGCCELLARSNMFGLYLESQNPKKKKKIPMGNKRPTQACTACFRTSVVLHYISLLHVMFYMSLR